MKKPRPSRLCAGCECPRHNDECSAAEARRDRRELARLRRQVARLSRAILWACGEKPIGGVWFGDGQPELSERRPYWWRTPLRDYAGPLDEADRRKKARRR